MNKSNTATSFMPSSKYDCSMLSSYKSVKSAAFESFTHGDVMPSLKNGARTANIFERPPSIVGIHVDSASAVHDHVDFKSFPKSVQRRFTNAVILCQTTDPKSLDARLLQLFLQSCASKCRVVVFVGIVTFTQDFDI